MSLTLVRTQAANVEGVDGFLVDVEVSRGEAKSGVGRTSIVGLPDAAVREAIDRITPALLHSGFTVRPHDHLVVNLAPADRRKEGPAFDLAIALGLAATVEDNDLDLPTDILFLAELALDGRLRPVRGVLPCVLAARSAGLRRAVVAAENVAEAAVVSGIEVFTAPDLRGVTALLRAHFVGAVPACKPEEDPALVGGPDLSEVRGQEHAKRAMAIAAAGAHNLLMMGPPGSGKTMLARRLGGLLPPLNEEEALDVTRVHSVAGLLQSGGLVRQRPFRAPHHNVSSVGLIGGGCEFHSLMRLDS